MGKAVRIKKAFERIRLRMLTFGITMSSSGNTVVSLTSRVRGEGVTTVAFGLASELTQVGNTLFIDACLEGNRVTKFLNLDSAPTSIEDLQRFDPQTKNHITQLKDPKLDILSLSIPDKMGNDLIDFSAPFWTDIRSYYKSIIVDSGSFQKPSSRMWANWADHTLLVIDTNSSTRHILERFSSDLKRFNIEISGFILNKKSFHIPSILWPMVK